MSFSITKYPISLGIKCVIMKVIVIYDSMGSLASGPSGDTYGSKKLLRIGLKFKHDNQSGGRLLTIELKLDI